MTDSQSPGANSVSTPPASSAAVSGCCGARRRQALLLVLVGGIVAFAWWQFQPAPAPVVPQLPEISDSMVATELQEADRLLREDPRSAQKWGDLGMALYANEFPKHALDYFAQAESLDPSDPRWTYLQGMILLKLEVSACIPFFEKSCVRFTETTVPRWRLADTYLAVGRPDDAEPHFQTLVDETPDHGPALLGLGRIALERQQYPQALEYLRRASTHPMAAKEAHRLRAHILRLRGQQTQAERAMHTYNQLTEDLPLADPIMQDVTRKMTGRKLFLTRVEAFVNAKQYEEGLQLLRKMAAAYPQDPLALTSLGRTLVLQALSMSEEKRFQANLTEAGRLFQESLRLDPDQSGIWLFLGLVHEFDSAKGADRQAIDRAAECFRKAIAFDPHDPLAHYHLAACLELQGDVPQAVALLRKNTRDRPDFLLNLARLADFLILQGNIPEAFHHLRQAAVTSRDNTVLLIKLLALAGHQQM